VRAAPSVGRRRSTTAARTPLPPPLGASASSVTVKVTVIDPLRGKVKFFPFVQNTDLLAITPWIVIASVAIALVAGTIGMRRFLDV
jgi:cell division protein FtsX